MPSLTHVMGTNGDDTFVADTAGGFFYQGKAGTDTVDFSSATTGLLVDLRAGGAQNIGLGNPDQFSSIESLIGGSGNDTFLSRDDASGSLYGGDGDDVLRAGSVTNTFGQYMDGGAGNDTLEGRLGDDTLLGGDGHDGLSGAGGNDQLFGGAGNDSMGGGDGDDLLVGGTGIDRMSGGNGADEFSFSAGDTGTWNSKAALSQADTVVDFTQGVDTINTNGGMYTGSTLLGASSVAHFQWTTGSGIVTGDVLLNGVHAQLTSSDWHP